MIPNFFLVKMFYFFSSYSSTNQAWPCQASEIRQMGSGLYGRRLSRIMRDGGIFLDTPSHLPYEFWHIQLLLFSPSFPTENYTFL